ncbi:MAG: SUMF1/EgtB/PvdO family nonheme iron enzyme [Prevotella sp.]|nr:SUMF1/EgtB/PvdO family nonheme iron enzyme [Prevotella sp.]
MLKSNKKKFFLIALAWIAVGVLITLAFDDMWERTSTNESCMSCHVHEKADNAWKQSKHHSSNNKSGVTTDCAACHLPPKGTMAHFTAKARMGMKDMWSYMTKHKDKINWERKGELEYAQKIVYNESCKKCHTNLFPSGLTDDGLKAHLYYEENEEKLGLQCISCHLDAGHFNPNYKHGKMEGLAVVDNAVKYDTAATVKEFKNFTETVPGTSVTISMVAIPGGDFTIGSPKSEPYHKNDEAPQKKISVSPFFMAEVEVTWNQYWAFYNETMSEGRTPPSVVYANNSRPDVDAITGPTPPFGFPDQGWGMGNRPAITMTHYAAETFCQWLSMKTGKKYRLPTEAEWEYAARGGTETPYFFEGSPKKYTNEGFFKKIFGVDTTSINGYIVYLNNSDSKTQEPSKVKANPFGLKNMLGNVMEYCADKYNADAYSKWHDGDKNPICHEGDEYVVRGGYYMDDAANLRCAARSHTQNDAWLKTDPQNPKSIWWYSDIKGIGFRVVCEVPEGVNAR